MYIEFQDGEKLLLQRVRLSDKGVVSLSEQLHGVPATDMYQRFDEKMAMLKKGQNYSKNKWRDLWTQASKTRGELSSMLTPFPNTNKLIDDIQRYRDAQMKEKTQGLSSPFPFET